MYCYLKAWKTEKVENIIKTMLQENMMFEKAKN